MSDVWALGVMCAEVSNALVDYSSKRSFCTCTGRDLEIKQDLIVPQARASFSFWRVFDINHISDDNPVASIKARLSGYGKPTLNPSTSTGQIRTTVTA